MSFAHEAIRKRLTPEPAAARRQIVFTLPSETVDRLDAIARTFSDRSQPTSRNAVIEDAINAYVHDALEYFRQEGIPLSALSAPAAEAGRAELFDTVVFPAHQDGFESVFLGERQWRYVRMSEAKTHYIRHVALYISKPASRITHYANVAPNGFEFDRVQRKYIIHFDAAPIALERPIILGSTPPASTRSPRYTTLERLLAAREFSEL